MLIEKNEYKMPDNIDYIRKISFDMKKKLAKNLIDKMNQNKKLI